jgi:hypothetical protein
VEFLNFRHRLPLISGRDGSLGSSGVASYFGGPADSESSVTLRPSFARGLPFRLLDAESVPWLALE